MARSTKTQEIPILPLRQGVIFPGTTVTLPVGRSRSVSLVQEIHPTDIIGLAVQRDASTKDPVAADLLPIGTFGRVLSVVKARPRQFRLKVEGIGRFEIDEVVGLDPYARARVRPAVETGINKPESIALAELLISRVRDLGPAVSDGLRRTLQGLKPTEQPGEVADLVTAALGLPDSKEAEVLLALDVEQRLRRVHDLIDEAETMAEIRSRIDREVRDGMGKAQREHILRQQLRAIQKELGENSDDDLEKLRQQLEQAKLPEEVQKIVDRELGRLSEMGSNQMESHVNRRYLEFISELPWSKRSQVSQDIKAVASKLDADHYGLEDVKKRIIEHIAVGKVAKNNRGTILCLVGPPGVGKTSLGRSIAEATNRAFARASLGGVRDEAEIRGHRRTYVGALPGRILTALKQAESKNPLLLLDEIDKLGNGWMGSPEAALLEVLDPEQNNTFTDHYLEQPFDLSEVFFVTTANSLENVSPPLRDRLEVVELQGYTMQEKQQIAIHHLIPKRLTEHNLGDDILEFSDSALESIISDYTREAGVRQLGRELTRICRSVTLEIEQAEEGRFEPVVIEPDRLRHYLGKQKFFNDVAERTSIPGVATGLAWTPFGGDILFVESSRMPGKGKLEITGHLGDVMKESVKAALTYIRSHADQLGTDPDFLESQDLHIHVPSGAIPKDGPSAGVTILTALTSLLTGRLARNDTAMTGECTLRGRVLPVGGIKSKVLAAHRSKLKRIVLPEKNRRDLEDVPASVQGDIEFIFADSVEQVLAATLENHSSTADSQAGTSTPGETQRLGV